METNCGLTKSELKAYSTLLLEGSLTVGELAKKTQLNRSHLYSVIASLIDYKLVGFSINRKKKQFYAEDPNILLSLWKGRVEQIQQEETAIYTLIENLKQSRTKEESDLHVITYKGKEEARYILEDILALGKGEEICSFGYEGTFKKVFQSYWKVFLLRRASRNLIFKGVYFNHPRASLPSHNLTYVRYITQNSQFNPPPMEIATYQDTVLIFFLDEKTPHVLQIKNPKIAEGIKGYFQFLWNSGEEFK